MARSLCDQRDLPDRQNDLDDFFRLIAERGPSREHFLALRKSRHSRRRFSDWPPRSASRPPFPGVSRTCSRDGRIGPMRPMRWTTIGMRL